MEWYWPVVYHLSQAGASDMKPSEGHIMRSTQLFRGGFERVSLRKGADAYREDIQNSFYRNGSGYYEIGVTKTVITLYNADGIFKELQRGQLYKR